MDHRRLTLFAGHYGSGKTNLALAWARALRRSGLEVSVADLDIVNPYFRTKDAEELLASEGIELVVSEFANSNLDVPAMPKEIYALTDGGRVAVLDVGGDDRGALALGRYVDAIRDEGDYEMLFVANFCRPLTRSAAEALDVMAEIEAACGLPFTAIVNNTNLGAATTADTVLESLPLAEELARLSGLPIKMTSVDERLAPALEGRIDNLFPVPILELYYMEKEG